MNSSIPKPLHEVAGRPIIDHIIQNIMSAGFDDIVVVINKDHKDFFGHLSNLGSNIKIAFQENQLGTGDAVKSGLADFSLSNVDNVLVVLGDTPLLKETTL